MLAALWAYDGWNNMPMVAAEIRNPGRNIPRALILGMLVVTAVYCGANLAYLYALPASEIMTSNSTAYRDALPVATKAAQTFLGSTGGKLVSIAFMLSAIGALNGSIFSNARVSFAMARDGLFFSRFGLLSEGARVPVWSIMHSGGPGQCAGDIGIVRSVDRLRALCVLDLLWTDHLSRLCVEAEAARSPAALSNLRLSGWSRLCVPVALWLVINTLQTSPVESAVGLILLALGLPFYFYYRRTSGNAAPDPGL